jgi:pimeloyl-ACP methyl ester carboxylesterase
MRVAILSLLLLGLCVRPGLGAGDDAKWNDAVKGFNDDFGKKSVGHKKRALDLLPTNDERTLHFIVKEKKLLEVKNWWIRYAAAERLGRLATPELRKKLHEYYNPKTQKKEVREGIIAAMGLVKHRDDPPVIVAALSDPDWEVRRMACWAAGASRIREAVPKMIDMLHVVTKDGTVRQAGELEQRVHAPLLFNLEEITGQTNFHTDIDQWKPFWEVNKDKTLPPVSRFDVGTFGQGVKLSFNDTFARKGTGDLVFVLPAPHRLSTYYMPYFNQWLFARWLYINLPPVTSFPDVKYNEHGDPIYPVEQLVDAFEDMRAQRKVDKAVVLADGFSCWVAGKYAQKYPDRVKGLVLINPYATNETYSKRLEEMLRSGDPDDELYAKVSTYQQKIGSALENERYGYVRTSCQVKDQGDLEIAFLQNIWADPNASSIAIPPFDLRGDQTSPIFSMLLFPPKANKLGGADDKSRLQRYYAKNMSIELKKSCMMPYMEEPENFEKWLRTFFDQISK